LNLITGEKLWEKALDVVPGTVVYYLAHSDDTLVLASSAKQYHVYGYGAKDGAALWQANFPWQNADHGGHMSHPAIVGGKVYVRPRVLDLHTGKLLPEVMPKGGCGSYACTAAAVVFRAGAVTLWDLDKGKVSQWERLRPDCWLSAIPACGLLLAPEGGGGCSCGLWLETSIAFRPKNKE
jgi:outer membrane protein assembly factor BamB